jgi:hypothetical protein
LLILLVANWERTLRSNPENRDAYRIEMYRNRMTVGEITSAGLFHYKAEPQYAGQQLEIVVDLTADTSDVPVVLRDASGAVLWTKPLGTGMSETIGPIVISEGGQWGLKLEGTTRGLKADVVARRYPYRHATDE